MNSFIFWWIPNSSPIFPYICLKSYCLLKFDTQLNRAYKRQSAENNSHPKLGLPVPTSHRTNNKAWDKRHRYITESENSSEDYCTTLEEERKFKYLWKLFKKKSLSKSSQFWIAKFLRWVQVCTIVCYINHYMTNIKQTNGIWLWVCGWVFWRLIAGALEFE